LRQSDLAGRQDAMKRHRYLLALFCLLFLAVDSGVPEQVQAALGESADSIASDRQALSAERGNTFSYDGYTVQEIDTTSVAVREYISSSDVVFGIAWNGFIRPDLTQLLGSYANEYQQALRQTPRVRGRRSVRVKTAHIVIEQWGHMRNLHGRAYVPALIPPGVSIDEIR
jgi:hypothetical protein